MARVVLRAFEDAAEAADDVRRLTTSLPGERFSVVASLDASPCRYLVVHDIGDGARNEIVLDRRIDLRNRKKLRTRAARKS